MERFATLKDYRDLGRDHGREFAALATEHFQAGGSAEVWSPWMYHRMVATADWLRSVGSTAREVQAWETSCVEAYTEGMDAAMALMIAIMRGRNQAALAAMPPLGHA